MNGGNMKIGSNETFVFIKAGAFLHQINAGEPY